MKKLLLPGVLIISIFFVLFALLQKPPQNNKDISGSTLGSTASAGLLTPTTVATPPVSYGKRLKTSNCVTSSGLEDKTCTPGDIIQGATKEQICTSGYSKSVRNVPQSVKDEAYREYGITTHTTGEYEVDHLISLELGGSNDISNLWPEAADPKPGFHEKDAVENYLHNQVCSGNLSLQEAQFEISDNWLDVYNKIH